MAVTAARHLAVGAEGGAIVSKLQPLDILVSSIGEIQLVPSVLWNCLMD
jgi:hypothetical protein